MLDNHIKARPLLTLLTITIIILCFSFSRGSQPETSEFEPVVAEVDPQAEETFLSPRNLQTKSAPIRITVDYSHLSGTTLAKEKLIYQLMNATVNFYSAAISVAPMSILKIPFSISYACGETIPSQYRNGIESDLVIFVIGSNAKSNYLAFGAACLLAAGSYRPFVGRIEFNLNDLTPGDSFVFEEHLLATMHEMVHVLGFLPNMYHRFPGANVLTKNINGVNIDILQVEPLTSKLRTYFNCPTLEGAYLENQGGSASVNKHFERRVFGNELMTSSISKDARISEFTFALLESSGWYTMNYSYADPFFWGKGKGCNFLETKCVNSQFQTNEEEFCSPLKKGGCMLHGRYGGFCGTLAGHTSSTLISAYNYWNNDTIVADAFSDNCPYIEAYSNKDCQNPADSSTALLSSENYGPGSMCFSGTLTPYNVLRPVSAYCFQYQCLALSNGGFELKIELGSLSATCKSGGAVSVKGYHGVIDCPNPNTFCNEIGKKYCKRGCMGKGVCNQSTGVCACEKGWGSTDCSMPIA